LKRREISRKPVERHRHDQVGLLEDFSPGARHPRSHGAGKFEAINVFEVMDEPARRPIVIARDGAGSAEHRRIGHRLGRDQPWAAHILGEGRSEPLAIGPLDEAHLAPAGRAERVMGSRGLAAGEAGRRVEDVERAAVGRAKRGDNPCRVGPTAEGFEQAQGHRLLTLTAPLLK
jgi:hypothetical protein